ncbi:MAG: relaxase domain-containing protein [Actinomycetota bacterium]|nr:relaxase domain-containing protein [Actinomycetota bacterium]
MSIGKLSAGQEGYYLAGVAHGVEDYYLEAAEVPGRWLGGGATLLGLSGEVEDGDLRSVLAGEDPSAGVSLRRGNARLCAFDLTLSAPKSVSLVWALGCPATAHAVVAAHEYAVDQTIGYLEREAVRSRRGHNGLETVEGGGVIGAAFRHRTSRAGDPQLHTHVLVANATLCEDGVWRALDGRLLYAHARTAGFLYQAELRHALTRSLEVPWEYPINGQAEITGFERHVLREFSRRRIEIEQAAAEVGNDSVRSRRRLAVRTRTAKDYTVDVEQLRADWRARADLHGLPSGRVEKLSRAQRPSVPASVQMSVPQSPRTALDADDRWLAQSMSIEGSIFDRRAVVRLVAHHCQPGAKISDVEARVDAFLASDHVQAVGVALSGVQYATVEHLELERRVLDAVEARRDGNYGVCVQPAVAAAGSLSSEQTAMVVALTTNGAGVSVVVGASGTGKTHALRVAREMWERDGYPVIGCALAARTAAELQASAGIPACSLDRLLGALDRDGVDGLGRRSVVVVDEAAMIGTRKLGRLIDHAGRADAKVVLVGDHHQLPAIEAGGVFAALAQKPDAIHLTENRRNRDPIERDALSELRDGDTARALGILTAHGRVHDHPTKADARKEMVQQWLDKTLDGDSAFMLAARRDDVTDLNQHARAALQAEGVVGPNELDIDGRAFAVGDWVMTLTNDYRLGVLNGQRGTIAGIDRQRRAVSVAFDDDTTKTIPATYLDAGGLDHAYAMTVHKAQGQTCDYVYVLGDEYLYREAGYSALTRGRHENHLHTVRTEYDAEAHHDPEPEDGYTTISRTLDRSHQQELAIRQAIEDALEKERSPRIADRDLGADIEL